MLDASNYSFVASIPVGTFPCAISIAPDGSAAYVTNRLSNNVSIIDLATFQVTNVAVGTFACDVMVSPDGTKAYVTNAGSISVVDMASFAVVETIANVPSGTCAVAATMDSNHRDKGHPEDEGHSGDERHHRDQGHVYVASNTTAGMVTVVDAGTNSVVAVLSVGVRPLGIGIGMHEAGRRVGRLVWPGSR